MSLKKEIQDIISQSIGTAQYHKFSAFPTFPLITDGVKAVADAAGAYWLLDVVGSYQHDPRLDKAFQVWKLDLS